MAPIVVWAEKADQDKPLILEAEKVSVNEVQQIYDLNGQILLIKGSIVVTGDQGKITVDPEGYEYVNLFKVAPLRSAITLKPNC